MAQIRGEVKQLQQMLGLQQSENGPVDVIFVCIDCEAYEHAQHKITEIGVSILDSRTVSRVEPGPNGAAWFALMEHLHIRPIEYCKLVNKRFIKGCPDAFNFGTTIFKQLKEVGPVLTRVFNDPTRIHEACNARVEIEDTSPKIVLVGHDLKNDTTYLRRLGFSPKHVIAHMDTQRLSRRSKSDQPGLTRLLKVLEIDASNLHNAGNDAAYTLQCLVSFAVRERVEPGSVGRLLLAEKTRRRAAKSTQTEKDTGQTTLLARKADNAAQPDRPVQTAAVARPSSLPAVGKYASSLPAASSKPHDGEQKSAKHGSRRARKLRARLEEQMCRSDA